jgi:DNA-binding NarL/FixJ family response regulator
MSTYCNSSSIKLRRPIQMVLASESKLFLEGFRKILEDADGIRIVVETSNREGVEKYIMETKPEFLFLDNRTLELNIHELLSLITKNSPDTKVILFDNHTEEEVKFMIHVTKETNSSELICIIKNLIDVS